MQTVWFILVAFMITAYVVLDGFDLGAGILHLIVTRTSPERQLVLRAIGPVWDGNEVWLIAGGGTLFFAFPLLYASSFSGFYLSLMIVLWLLIGRGIGIEFRGHLEVAAWTGFFDGVFSVSSFLLVILFGVALGNVIRGVPLQSDHFFFEALWTNFRVTPSPGILDWYTCIAGLLALAALAMHGALYLTMKTEAPVSTRSRVIARFSWPFVILLSAMALVASLLIRPELGRNYLAHPVWFAIPAVVVASLLLIPYYLSHGADSKAFFASSVFLAAMLAGAAVALYPDVLPAASDPANSLTIHNAAAGPESLRLGLFFWLPGMAIAIGYFVVVYRMFRGKVSVSSQGY